MLQTDSFVSINRLLSFESISISMPRSSSREPSDCFMLLYTRKGNGTLHIDKQVYSLQASASNFLLMDCRYPFTLTAASSPWEYQTYYFTGAPFAELFSLFPEKWGTVLYAAPCSTLAEDMEALQSCAHTDSIHSAIAISGLLYRIVTECLLEQYPEDATVSLPDYLIKIKELFDHHYEELYTLDELAARFHVSKYRLCREFHECFGLSPIQYLNRSRINAAKNLLADSRYKVYEAGCLVGIDNTNHFITLFKKYTGYTPEKYRQHLNQSV